MADVRKIIEDLGELEKVLESAGNDEGAIRIARIREVVEQKELDPAACIYTVDHLKRMLQGSPEHFSAGVHDGRPDPVREKLVSQQREAMIRRCMDFLEDQGR